MKKAGMLGFAATLLAFMFAAVPDAYAFTYADVSREASVRMEKQVEPDEVDQQELFLIQQAFSAGLQTVDAHTYTNSLTDLDKEILQLMNETIPAIINKMQNSLLEVEDELMQANLTLAKKIIANQTLYPEPTDWELAATMAATTSFMNAVMSNKLNEHVMDLLYNQGMDMLEENFGEGEEGWSF